MDRRLAIFIFLCFFFFTSTSFYVYDFDTGDFERRLRTVLRSMGTAMYDDTQALPDQGIFQGDINEVLEVVFSFIQAVVAMSSSITAKQPIKQQIEDSPKPWTEWTDCSATCGGGTQSRTRGCDDTQQPNEAPDLEAKKHPYKRFLAKIKAELNHRTCVISERACNTELCDDSQWDEWSEWSTCQQMRTRSCAVDSECSGPIQEVRPCPTEVRTIWGAWSEWSDCTTTCGNGGRQTRARFCSACANRNEIGRENRSCLPQPRPCSNRGGLAFMWNQWDSWSACSRSCGRGEQLRRRVCGRGRSRLCPGQDSEKRFCNGQDCSASWSKWSWVTPCTPSCGTGSRQRSRTCLAAPCIGPSQETVFCSNGPCER